LISGVLEGAVSRVGKLASLIKMRVDELGVATIGKVQYIPLLDICILLGRLVFTIHACDGCLDTSEKYANTVFMTLSENGNSRSTSSSSK
jgi:hypothetical protein